jgi:tetratricopeptide (TPR) repeat protein
MKLSYAQKKWTETVDACLKLLKNGNESSIIRTKLGVSYYNLKNYNCGAETFADIPPLVQNEYTYYYAAMCYKALKDHKRAIEFLEKAIKDGISTSIASYYGEIADSDEKLIQIQKGGIGLSKRPTV